MLLLQLLHGLRKSDELIKEVQVPMERTCSRFPLRETLQPDEISLDAAENMLTDTAAQGRTGDRHQYA